MIKYLLSLFLILIASTVNAEWYELEYLNNGDILFKKQDLSTPTYTYTNTKLPTKTFTPTLTSTKTATPIPTHTFTSTKVPTSTNIFKYTESTAPNLLRRFSTKDHLYIFWSAKRNSTTDINYIILNKDLTVFKEKTTLITARYEEAMPFAVAKIDDNKFALHYIDNRIYTLRIYENNKMVRFHQMPYIYGGGYVDIAYSPYTDLLHSTYYGSCAGSHTCTYTEIIRMDSTTKYFSDLTDWDGTHQLNPNLAISPEGITYFSNKHPRTGSGDGGAVVRFRKHSGAIDKNTKLISEKTYMWDEWGDITWNNSFAAIFVYVENKTASRPWEEPGDFFTTVVIFDKSYNSYTPLKTINLAKQKYIVGHSITIDKCENGFIASYPLFGPPQEPVASVISLNGDILNTYSHGNIAGDAYTAICDDNNIYMISFNNNELSVWRTK